MNHLRASEDNETNSKAKASLILGILAIFISLIMIVGVLLGVIGIIVGTVGLKEIKQLKQAGKKVAIAGIICSSLGVLIPLFVVINILVTQR